MLNRIVAQIVVVFTEFALALIGVLCVLFFIPVLICQCVLVAWRGVWQTWGGLMADVLRDK